MLLLLNGFIIVMKFLRSFYLIPQGVSQYDRTRGPPGHIWKSDWTPHSCSSDLQDLHNNKNKQTKTEDINNH